MEDQPKSSLVVANVDPSLQEVPRREKLAEGSIAVAQGILGCHSSLVVSVFLYLSS